MKQLVVKRKVDEEIYFHIEEIQQESKFVHMKESLSKIKDSY